MALSGSACAADHRAISVRTETYPRPPYSEATYYIYERDGAVICTKLAVCDKHDACDADYHVGAFKTSEDAKVGKPYLVSPAVSISQEKLRKHQCLTKYVPGAI
jgi:hypothetical protein